MKYFLLVCFFFPARTFAQAENYKTLPGLEKQLKAVFIGKSAPYVNITDSVLKLMPVIENRDTSYHDSVLYKASYTINKNVFTLYFTAYNTYYQGDAVNTKGINLTITQNSQTVLKDFPAYSEEYVESYAEEIHAYLVNDSNNGRPNIITAWYNVRAYIENDEMDCKQCQYLPYKAASHVQMTREPCKMLLEKNKIPFLLR
jgi:hypothetical protein